MYIKEKFRIMEFRNIKNISKLSIVFISKTRFHTNFVGVKKYNNSFFVATISK